MLTSPITVTIAGVAKTLSRINQDNFSAVYLYKASLEEIRLTIRHSYEGKQVPGQMERHNIDMVHTVWDAATGVATITQVYNVVRLPRGAAVTDAVNFAKGLDKFTDDNISAIVAWES